MRIGPSVVWIARWDYRLGGLRSLTCTPGFKVRRHWRFHEGLGWNIVFTTRYLLKNIVYEVEKVNSDCNKTNSFVLVLPLLWTFGHPKGLSLTDLSRFLSYNTAKLARLHHRKGSIAVGMDADFVIWNPDEQITVGSTKWSVNLLCKMTLVFLTNTGNPRDIAFPTQIVAILGQGA